MSVTPHHYQITSDAKSTTIQFQPAIGNAAWGDIERVGTELLTSVNERHSSAWLIDLSRLEYMGSATVALLVRVWKAVQAGGGKVVVVCGDGMPREVIKLAGLDKVWTISTTTDDGYKSLGVRTPVAAGSATGVVERAADPGTAGGFPVLGVVSLVGALAAGGVLAAVSLDLAEIDRNLSQLGMFGGAGIAVAMGLVSLFKEASWGRALGLLGLLAGVVVGTMGFLRTPADADGSGVSVPSQSDPGHDADDPGDEKPSQSDPSEPETGGAPEDALPVGTEDPADAGDTAANPEGGSGGTGSAAEETAPTDPSSEADPTDPSSEAESGESGGGGETEAE